MFRGSGRLEHDLGSTLGLAARLDVGVSDVLALKPVAEVTKARVLHRLVVVAETEAFRGIRENIKM